MSAANDDTRLVDGDDADREDRLRSEVQEVLAHQDIRGFWPLLNALHRITYGHDLSQDVVGARAIAQAVFGEATSSAIQRVYKFERDGLCTFRRWGLNAPISLTRRETLDLRRQIESRQRAA